MWQDACMSHVAGFMLHVACCMLQAAWRMLQAAGFGPEGSGGTGQCRCASCAGHSFEALRSKRLLGIAGVLGRPQMEYPESTRSTFAPFAQQLPGAAEAEHLTALTLCAGGAVALPAHGTAQPHHSAEDASNGAALPKVVACCLVYAACCMLHVAPCLLYVACSMLHVALCLLLVACFMHVA